MSRYTVDPDEFFDRDICTETADDFVERVRGKGVSHYAVQTIYSGEWAEVRIYPCWKSKGNAPKKKPPNEDAKKRYNHKVAVDRLTRLLNHNFKPGKDLFYTFTFDDAHCVETAEEGFALADKGIKRIKYRYKKAGIELKAVYKVEIKRAKNCKSKYLFTAEGRPLYRAHLHIVMNGGVDHRELMKAWKIGKTKRIEVLRWDPEGFYKLAKYLCKDTKEGKRKWNSTFNLEKPPQPKTSYSGKSNSKRKIAEVAVQTGLQKEYFEQILPEYAFAQSEVAFRDFGDGCYIHARMYRKEKAKK